MAEDLLETRTEKLVSLREEKAEVKHALDLINSEERKIQNELIEVMEIRNIKSFKHKKFGTVTSASKLWARIVDFDKALKFFEEKGLDKEIFQLQARSGNLNEFVRDTLDKGEILPEGVNFTPSQYISIRKV